MREARILLAAHSRRRSLGTVEGVEEFAPGTGDRDLKLFIQDPAEIGMTTDFTLELELRNLEESGGGWNVALSDVDRGGAFVRIKRERGWTFAPTGRMEVE